MNEIMSKSIKILLTVGMFSITTPVLAASVVFQGGMLNCENGLYTANNGATSTVSTDINVCHPTNGDPWAVMQPWGMNGHQSEHLLVPAGSIVHDEAGITFQCPFFAGVFGCYNLTSLDYWKTQARTIAHEGVVGYSYWLTH